MIYLIITVLATFGIIVSKKLNKTAITKILSFGIVFSNIFIFGFMMGLAQSPIAFLSLIAALILLATIALALINIYFKNNILISITETILACYAIYATLVTIGYMIYTSLIIDPYFLIMLITITIAMIFSCLKVINNFKQQKL